MNKQDQRKADNAAVIAQFDYVDPPFAPFNFSDYRLCDSERLGYLLLSEALRLSGFEQLSQQHLVILGENGFWYFFTPSGG